MDATALPFDAHAMLEGLHTPEEHIAGDSLPERARLFARLLAAVG